MVYDVSTPATRQTSGGVTDPLRNKETDVANSNQQPSPLPAGRIRAIPTIHNGVAFRSRLEARVAATMTALGCHWEYEPEGYILHDGTNYLPDFRVGAAFIEVKPGGSSADDYKIGRMAESDPDLRCYLVSERRQWEHPLGAIASGLTLIGVRGVGLRSSAIWAPCPACHAVAPWRLYDPNPCGVCHVTSEPEQWWDGYYANDRKRPVSMVWPTMPQYRDGSFVWDDGINKGWL